MSLTNDVSPGAPVIYWPESVNDAPDGWTWGRHVSCGATGDGYYLIRESDDATLIAIQRPDLDDVPTTDELDAALASAEDQAAEEAADDARYEAEQEAAADRRMTR